MPGPCHIISIAKVSNIECDAQSFWCMVWGFWCIVWWFWYIVWWVILWWVMWWDSLWWVHCVVSHAMVDEHSKLIWTQGICGAFDPLPTPPSGI